IATMGGTLRLGLLVTCLACLTSMWTAAAVGERRVALVIGNGTYLNAAKLANPPRNADAIAKLFRTANFDVVQAKRDLANAQFRQELSDLNLWARNADIAVVFFAGHGIEINGTNYLLPTDVRLRRAFDVDDEAIPLERVLRAIEPAKRLR